MHLILTLWCDFEPLIICHHREEAHVLLPNDPEQLRQSDLIPTLSFVPYINPVVPFWASYHFPSQRTGTCCTLWRPWTPSSLSTHLTKWKMNIRITYVSHFRTYWTLFRDKSWLIWKWPLSVPSWGTTVRSYHTWLLLTFFPLPVGHPPHPPCTL